jgi:hypothetical protein
MCKLKRRFQMDIIDFNADFLGQIKNFLIFFYFGSTLPLDVDTYTPAAVRLPM